METNIIRFLLRYTLEYALLRILILILVIWWTSFGTTNKCTKTTKNILYLLF